MMISFISLKRHFKIIIIIYAGHEVDVCNTLAPKCFFL